MARGGHRPNAGRPKGTISKARAAVVEACKAEVAQIYTDGEETPLGYMLRVMRDSGVDEKRRDQMAIAAASFIHPKLAAVEHSGNAENPLQVVHDVLGALDGASRGLPTGIDDEGEDDASEARLAS